MAARPGDSAAAMTFGFCRDEIDRAAYLRGDQAHLQRLLRAPTSRAIVVAGDALMLRTGPDGQTALHRPADVAALCEAAPIFLGLHDAKALFALALATPGMEPGAGLTVIELRTILAQGSISVTEISGIAAAKSLVNWHARHGFCANCGTATTVSEAGWRRDCPTCNAQHFPRTDPVAIMAIGDDTRCLLGRQTRFPPGMWSCLAGFVEPGETAEDAARREAFEEAGIYCDEVTVLATQPWPYPSSLMIGCLARPRSFDITIDPAELEAARWFSRAEVRALLDGADASGLRAPPPFAIAHYLLRQWLTRAEAAAFAPEHSQH